MSSLLINENPLQVLPSLACAVGLNEAVIAQQMHYWMGKSQHFYDGRRWIYNSVANWQKQFPFWSEATIKRALGSLENQGVIVSGNYNHDPRDRSKWYSLNYEVLRAIESTTQPVDDAFGQNDQMEQCKMTKCIVADCTNAPGQNDPMQLVNMTQPLPETTTETTQEITQETTTEIKNTIGTSADAAMPTRTAKQNYSPEFETAWQAYPKRAGGNPKPSAFKAWNARIREGVTPQTMLEGVKRYASWVCATGKINTEYVKQASTFFGPDRHFEESWQIPAVPVPGGVRNTISRLSGLGRMSDEFGESSDNLTF